MSFDAHIILANVTPTQITAYVTTTFIQTLTSALGEYVVSVNVTSIDQLSRRRLFVATTYLGFTATTEEYISTLAALVGINTNSQLINNFNSVSNLNATVQIAALVCTSSHYVPTVPFYKTYYFIIGILCSVVAVVLLTVLGLFWEKREKKKRITLKEVEYKLIPVPVTLPIEM